jgi:hypothetical protein
MALSRMLAGLIGPTLIAIAATMVLNLGLVLALAQQASRLPPLLFVSGILLFVTGLAIARVHNIWSGGWPVLVTVLGWLAIVGGLVCMLFPTRFFWVATQFGQNTGAIIIVAFVLVVLGALLAFKAYSRT